MRQISMNEIINEMKVLSAPLLPPSGAEEGTSAEFPWLDLNPRSCTLELRPIPLVGLAQL